MAPPAVTRHSEGQSCEGVAGDDADRRPDTTPTTMAMSFLRRALPGVLLASVLAACGDSTAPKAPENLPLAAGDVAAISAGVDSVYDQPILDMLRGGTTSLTSLRSALQLAVARPAGEAEVRGALTIGQSRVAREIVIGEPVVPTLVRGVTFVWNGTQWTVDTLANGTPRPGAPANGVRFTLYALAGNGLPTGPALGYLEVTDNSTATSARWTTRVVTNAGLTIVQSSSTMTASGGSVAIAQTGFVTDGTRRIEQSLSLSSTALRASWSAPWAGLSMDFALTQSLSGATLSYTFGTPRGTLRLLMTVTTSGGNAQILVNGAPWARQSWSAGEEIDDNAWQKADGSGPITEADALTMLDILDFFAALNALADFDEAVTGLLGGVTPA